MVEYLVRTRTSPGSSSSGVISTKRLLTTWSSWKVRYALNLCMGGVPPRSRGYRQNGVARLVRQRHVFAGAHLDQSADGARKLLAVRSLPVQILRLDCGRQQELHPMIVEHIDEPRKAAGGVAHLGSQMRDAGKDNHGESTRQLQIVELRPRPLAEAGEIEPNQAPGALARLQGAPLDCKPRVLVRTRAHALEALRELGIHRVRERRVIAGRVLELAQAIVDAGVDLDNVKPVLEQCDCGQKILSLQAIGVEVVGAVVGGH